MNSRILPVVLAITMGSVAWSSTVEWDVMVQRGYCDPVQALDYYNRFKECLKSTDYQMASPPLFPRAGNFVYFVGRKRSSATASGPRDTVVRMDLSSGAVEERLSFEDAARAFPHGMLTEGACVAIDPSAAYLAIGRTERVITHETRTTTTSIYLVDLAGKTIRPLVDNQRDNRDYLFSPDGRHLLFRSFAPECEDLTNSMGRAEAYSVCLADTTNDTLKVLKPVPEGKTEAWFPRVAAAWSPDSRAVVFQYYRPLADSAVRMEIIACEAPDFAPKTLLTNPFGYLDLFFVDADRFIGGESVIDLINAKTGQLQRLVSTEGKPLSEKPIWNVRRAGDSVAYRQGQMPNDVPRSVAIPPAASSP